MKSGDWIIPDWPAPEQVHAVSTTRRGGVSRGPWTSMNPADHVGDEAAAVASNRRRLQQVLNLPGPPVWLQQVHGTAVVDAAQCDTTPAADAAYSREPGVVCAVLTADCLPLLLCERNGRGVAAVHAGWRGLAAGVIERAVGALGFAGDELLAWLGPAISAPAYRVGEEVREAFLVHDPGAATAFRSGPEGGWHANMYKLARQRLADCGVDIVYGGDRCTFHEPEAFYSYRRDGVTGRMATLIWLSPAGV